MRTILPLFMLFLMIGCSEDSTPYSYSSESTIYSDSETTQFKELVLILKPYILVGEEKQYIVTDTVKNVVIKVNDKSWGTFNSYDVDTSIFLKTLVTNFYTTSTTTKYSVVAEYTSNSGTLSTAGEYVELLNNYMNLKPGDYICEIESFEIKRNDGTVETIKPYIVTPIEVKENCQSTLVGEFEVQVNND
jgi:hypothetical protein